MSRNAGGSEPVKDKLCRKHPVKLLRRHLPVYLSLALTGENS